LNQNSLLALDWKGIPRFRTQTACVAPVVAVTAIAGTAICRDPDDGMRLADDIIAPTATLRQNSYQAGGMRERARHFAPSTAQEGQRRGCSRNLMFRLQSIIPLKFTLTDILPYRCCAAHQCLSILLFKIVVMKY